MEFFKGIISVCFLYAVAWSIYHFGFIRGYEDAKSDYAYRFNKTARAFAGN